MWTIPAIQAAAAHLRHGTIAIVPGAGHIGPLLEATPELTNLITTFWREPGTTITTQQAAFGGASVQRATRIRHEDAAPQVGA